MSSEDGQIQTRQCNRAGNGPCSWPLSTVVMNRFYILCGPLSILCLLIFLPSSRSLPPISPAVTSEELANHYRQNHRGFEAGVVFILFSAVIWPVYSIGLNNQLARIPGVSSTILSTQVSAGNCVGLSWATCAILFASTIYRLDRDPALTQILSDTAWLYFAMMIPCLFVQDIAISSAILSDYRAKPLLPRWLACANTLLPFGWFGVLGTHCVYHGPISWNGAITFWLTAATFFVQLILNVICFWKAAGTPDDVSK